MTKTSVLIVDDVAQVRQDLRTLLSLISDFEIVGEATNGLEAVALADALRPNVVLMDLAMPVMDGYEATRQIKRNCLADTVIVLTIHAEPSDVQRAKEAGADYFIVKGTPMCNLIQAIKESKCLERREFHGPNFGVISGQPET